jgi:hypothetical protein
MFCSQLSLSAGEPLFASAGPTDVFFLLEYNGAWEDKAFEKSSIPEEVKQHLQRTAKSLSSAKILVIKRSPASQSSQLHFYLALAREQNPKLFRYVLNSYEDVLDIDLMAALEGDERFAEHLQTTPLFLACTNGRRDLCCAKFGFAVYEALREVVGDAVWECSHIGGHRVAPNVYHLPYGVLYGRVQPGQAASLVEAARDGQMYLDQLRGRSAYSEAQQAAEYTLRCYTGELRLEAFRLADSSELEPGRYRINFQSTSGDQEYLLDVTLQVSEARVYDSCLLDKQTQIKTFSVALYHS